MHHVWAEGDTGECMDKGNMMVVIHTDLCYALTAPSMTWMTLLSQILLLHFVSNLHCAFSLSHARQVDISQINPQQTQFGVWNVHMACMTRAHTLIDYDVSHIGHWNQTNADTKQNRYTNYFSWRYVFNHCNLLIYCIDEKWAITICSSESNSCMAIGCGGNMQG